MEVEQRISTNKIVLQYENKYIYKGCSPNKSSFTSKLTSLNIDINYVKVTGMNRNY